MQFYLLAALGLPALGCGDSPSDGTPSTANTTASATSATGSTTSQTTGGTTTTSTTSTTTTGGVGSTTTGSGGTSSSSSASTTSGTTGGPAEDCNTGTLTTRLPCQLSETGLYAEDMVTLGEGVHPYAPQFTLWSDNADKHRWIWLPPDSQIDTTDMDFWSFPAGTKLWKEFSRDGTRVETRLIEKQTSGTWYTVAYHWREDQNEADAVPDGMMNASGTEHDVPNADACWGCHSQQPDKALGFAAVQLAHAPEDADNPDEWTLERLIEADLLTAPPEATLEFSAGWSEELRATYGYLHANCGTCHNPKGSANSQTGLDLLIKVDDLAGAAEESSVYVGTVDVDIMKLDTTLENVTKRIDPGDLANSAIYQRFLTKGEEWSMPPLGTEVTDPTGQELLEQFIMGLE